MADILITGASGFIGRHLYNWLVEQGHNVLGIGLSNQVAQPNFNYRQADVLDERLIDHILRDNNITLVYHLAGQTSVPISWENPEFTMNVNVSGTRNILEACTRYNAGLVFPSSLAVYGISEKLPIPEDHPSNPQNPYGQSKAEAEKLCHEYLSRGITKVKIVRLSNVYGEAQKARRDGPIIATFANKLYKKEVPVIYGDGNQLKDFIHVDDALKALELVVESDLSEEPTNIGTGRGTSINRLVEILSSLSGESLEPDHVDTNFASQDSIPDISKLRELGFTPQIDIEEGLRRYWNWFVSAVDRVP
jgi:UDP-glucose 4-epimerase